MERIGYDLSRFDDRINVREAEELVFPKIKVRETDKTVKLRYSLSPFAVIGYLLITALMIAVVYCSMILNELAIENATLTKSLSKVKTESVQLQAQYEKKINLNEIERRAMELGMQYPETEQVTYVTVDNEDYAVVFNNEQSWFEKVLNDLMAKFKIG